MRRIVFLLTLIIATLAAKAQKQEVQWMSFSDALSAQQKNPKPIFVDVYTEWCGPCKMLDLYTFSDEGFVAYINKNYYAVKFNAEGNETVTLNGKKYGNPNYDINRPGRNSAHELVSYFKITGYPTMLVLDDKGELKASIIGYHSYPQLKEKI